MLKGMARIPETIPVSPMSLVCPRCKTKPDIACTVLKDDIEMVHIERIEAAARKAKG